MCYSQSGGDWGGVSGNRGGVGGGGGGWGRKDLQFTRTRTTSLEIKTKDIGKAVGLLCGCLQRN